MKKKFQSPKFWQSPGFFQSPELFQSLLFFLSPGFQNFGRVRDFKILAESGILKFWQSPGARGAPPGFSKIFLIHFLAVLGVFSPKMDMFRRHVKKSLSVTDHLRTHAVNDLP